MQRFKDFLLEKKALAIPSSIKNKASKDVQKVMPPNTYHDHIPLERIFSRLKTHGLVPLDDDNTEWSGILAGKSGRALIKLAHIDSHYTGAGSVTTFTPYKNALNITWHKMESGKFEIVTYIT